MKGIAYPIRTYRVRAVGAGEQAGAEVIEEQREGFRFSLEPDALDVDDRRVVRETLRRALETLDGAAADLEP